MQKNWRDLIKPKKLEADEKSLTPTYGKFVGEPLERGFGTTIGNSLRRVLLSSLYGAAITAVRIRGILHEFSTLPGVTEDVTDIVLNLKEVRLKLIDAAQDTVRLSVKGEREVTAADIVTGPRVELLNPEQHIATLSKEGSLDIEMVVRHGPVDALELSVRSASCLHSADIKFSGKLVQRSEQAMRKTKNFGRESVSEIREIHREMGLGFGMRLENFPKREELERRRLQKD